MPSIDTSDSIEINADAQKIFDVILNYPEMHTWFPIYKCVPIDAKAGAQIGEGSRFDHAVDQAPVVIRFTRTIRKIIPGRRIEETYDSGQLKGNGEWSFDQQGKTTKVSYHCAVSSQDMMMHIGFLLTGTKGHNRLYQQLLHALKRRAEA
jgi:hypothetical protein